MISLKSLKVIFYAVILIAIVLLTIQLDLTLLPVVLLLAFIFIQLYNLSVTFEKYVADKKDEKN